MEHGHKIWYFPDGELPPAGDEPMKAHESIIVLNDQNHDANITMTIYYTDKDPVCIGPFFVKAKRVKCFRMDEPEALGGYELPVATQYAIKLVSDQKVVVQYGRLDTRQEKMAFYTTNGCSFS